ncbi:LINE-1 retrotransposable element ORF2 protein [Smittium culicis]|uniref:LINE-1 retrotransposable element ORF2 protein n=1 Tax=Smittium culicis TaxID=133412 RepID=A0A1R1X7A1_9FUNG|nr:LINE-1 retrotransposable element ORF2 protein [Smittium culicis]
MQLLDRNIEHNEIINAIEETPNNKAPGPDGLSFEFYKKFKKNVTNHLANIFNKMEMKKWNSINGGSTIVLIPKKGDLKDLRNYRPITLANSGEKIYTKILANRQQKFMSNLIYTRQSDSIKDRNMLDKIHSKNFLIENSKINPQITNGY